MSEYEIIGKADPKLDGLDMVTGRSIYIDDLRLPRMLYGRILRSAYAHAKIVNIDTSKAEKLPGVKAVISKNNTPHFMFGAMHPYNIVRDYSSLAYDKVRYFGDAVAAVAAKDPDIAAKALDLIEVEYEPLPVINTPEEALKPGASVIHSICPDNIADVNHVCAGDVKKGFAESDLIIEGDYHTPPQEHCSMELHGAVASVDPAGRVTLWVTTQTASIYHHDIMKLSGVAYRNINVIPTKCGGAFGGKNETTVEVECLFLSQMTGCPVKMIYTREEEFTASSIRHPTYWHSRIGVKKDGTIMARQAKVLVDNGAYTGLGQGILYMFGSTYASIYNCPNVKVDSYLVYTNNVAGGAMRGYGNPQGFFAGEIEIDRTAEALNMSPIEFRLKNLPVPHNRSSCGIINPAGFRECLEAATGALSFNEKWKGWKK